MAAFIPDCSDVYWVALQREPLIVFVGAVVSLFSARFLDTTNMQNSTLLFDSSPIFDWLKGCYRELFRCSLQPAKTRCLIG